MGANNALLTRMTQGNIARCGSQCHFHDCPCNLGMLSAQRHRRHAAV